MATVKEKIDQLCLEYNVRSSYPEKFKEAIRMLVIEEVKKITK